MPCPELACPREEWRLGPGQCCFTCQEPTPATGELAQGCPDTGRAWMLGREAELHLLRLLVCVFVCVCMNVSLFCVVCLSVCLYKFVCV